MPSSTKGPFPSLILGTDACSQCGSHRSDIPPTTEGHGPCDLIHYDEDQFKRSVRWPGEFGKLVVIPPQGGPKSLKWWSMVLGFCPKCWAPKPDGLYALWLQKYNRAPTNGVAF